MGGKNHRTLAELAKALNLRSGDGRRLPPLILMTDARRLPDPLAAAMTLPRGSAVILRDYDSPARAALARRLARLCRRRGLKLLIAADWALALAVGAQGVHLPEGLAHRARAVRRNPRWLITASAHSRAALVEAARAGADAAILAPVFATPSHPGRRPLGAMRFARLRREAPLPVYALGGVSAAGARRLKETGAVGIAAIGALQPERKCRSR
ncbi:MAG: thiamine phosphate synthase [Alphaproteobacteria bacterium]